MVLPVPGTPHSGGISRLTKKDDDLLFITRLAQMAVYELTVHGAGVTSFRKQRPTNGDKDNRMDMNNDG